MKSPLRLLAFACFRYPLNPFNIVNEEAGTAKGISMVFVRVSAKNGRGWQNACVTSQD